MHFIVTMSNSHKKSLDYHSLLGDCCFLSSNESCLWKFSFYHLFLIWKRLLCHEIKQSLWKFSRNFTRFPDIKIVLKIITKMKGKINLHTEDTLKGTIKRQLHSLQNIKRFIQNLEKIKFPIRHSQPISHTST